MTTRRTTRQRRRPSPLGLLLGLSLVVLGATGLDAAFAANAEAEPAASRSRQLARVQLHRNGNRGIAYLPRAVADGSSEPSTFTLQPIRLISLPGDPVENVRSNVHPIDIDGDGWYELLQVHGYRFARLWGTRGELRWEIRNPAGRLHRSEVHRDTLAVLDVDGDRRQEIVHCWLNPDTGTKQLVLRRGDTGAVLRAVPLTGDYKASECHIAAFKVPERSTPLILVSRQTKLPNANCTQLYVDVWPVTAAYDTSLNALWQRDTCTAGHYAWPLDENGDGAAEAIFVGKYLLRPNGTLQCKLEGWNADHVDTMVVGDLNPQRPGHEALAIGTSGNRLYDAATCTLLSMVPLPSNAQHMSVARLDPAIDGPAIMIRLRNTDTDKVQPLFRIDGTGRLLGQVMDDNRHPQTTGLMPMTNANLDGAAASEDMVAWFGQVIGRDGRLRLDESWYWGLQRLTGDEVKLSSYNQWTNEPVVVDLNGDGRDEMITWGRRLIVVGSRWRPDEPASR